MRQLWELVVGFFETIWETGNRWARAAIIFLVVPPLVALIFAIDGFNAVATAVALTPLLALVFVPLAMIDPLVIVAVAGALGFHPTAAAIRQWLVRWIPRYLGSTMAYAVYLYFVPIGSNPWLVLPLIGAVGAAALFAIGGALSVAKFSATIAVGITVAFFLSSWFGWFGGKKEVRAEAAATAQAEPRVEEFTVNAGEEQVTVVVGPGTFHRTRATDQQGNPVEWIALSSLPDGNYREYRMKPVHSWRGGGSEGLLRIRGVADRTTLRFERVR